MRPSQMAGAGVFFVIWLLLMLSFTVGWVVFLVAAWRGMKAQEAIAAHLKNLVLTQPGGYKP
jgi:hypothetical protein